MTLTQVARMIQSFETLGIQTAYYQFSEDETVHAPYAVYYYPNRDDFIADNLNHVKIEVLRIELYTDTKDFELEEDVEALLPFPYSKETTYIDSERLYESIYEMEVIING